MRQRLGIATFALPLVVGILLGSVVITEGPALASPDRRCGIGYGYGYGYGYGNRKVSPTHSRKSVSVVGQTATVSADLFDQRDRETTGSAVQFSIYRLVGRGRRATLVTESDPILTGDTNHAEFSLTLPPGNFYVKARAYLERCVAVPVLRNSDDRLRQTQDFTI